VNFGSGSVRDLRRTGEERENERAGIRVGVT